MGQAALAWQRALRTLQVYGELFADEVDPRFHSLVRPMADFRAHQDDLVLYHHGIASPLAGKLLHVNAHRGVVFHNITPPTAYRGTQLEEALISGRAQLAALASGVEVSIGVSAYNAAELREAGHRNVQVVPLYVEPARFALKAADASMLARLRALPGPRMVSVSRVVPHKRVEDLVTLHAELRRLCHDAHLFIVGGYAPGHASFRALKKHADEVGNVTFLGRLDHAELVAAYRAADVYVSMSEHEGFGVPLIEAMAAELPVLAFGAAAVPETMGGAGMVFDEKHHAALAEIVRLLTDDAQLRTRVLAGQARRVGELSLAATSQALSTALATVASASPKVSPPVRKRKRVGIVVQRFGPHITGGAEAHARSIAQRLAMHVDVEVLTSCATDHLTWANELPEGTEVDEGLVVHRFASARPRAMRPFNALSREVFGRSNDALAEAHWLAEQGPLLPGLLTTLSERRTDFDAFVFFTALYAPTVHGLPLVSDRALLVPTAHDEPPMAFGVYDDVFKQARALLCNTEEEQAFIAGRFEGVQRSRVVGVGIEPLAGDGDRFRETYGVKGPYLLYVGRLEDGKGVGELVRLHQRLVKHFHDAPSLVLVGAGGAQVKGARVVKTGRVDEQTKWDALAGALAVVVPSRYESLSLLTLEAFAAGTPVIGNEASPVIAGQLQRSLAGAPFDLRELESFVAALKVVKEERDELSRRAKAYAASYQWPQVIAAYLDEFERLATGPAPSGRAEVTE